MKSSAAFLVVLGLLITPASVFAIGFGQTDDFEDGTVQGWVEGAPSPNMPTNVSDGGPLGVGDNYLKNISSGGFGAGSRLVMFNQSQWQNGYLAAMCRPTRRASSTQAGTSASPTSTACEPSS